MTRTSFAQTTQPSERLEVGGDTYSVRWIGKERFDADWQKKWAAEGNSTVEAADGKLIVRGTKQNVMCTVWYRHVLPQNVYVRFKARGIPPIEENACNLNLFLHATETDGSPVRERPAAKYDEYHKIPNYIVTLTGGFQDGWCRVRRDPGFNLLAEDASIKSEVGKDYDIVVTYDRGRLRYYINGRRIHDVTDKDPLPGGQFGLRTWCSNVEYDFVELGELISVEATDALAD